MQRQCGPNGDYRSHETREEIVATVDPLLIGPSQDGQETANEREHFARGRLGETLRENLVACRFDPPVQAICWRGKSRLSANLAALSWGFSPRHTLRPLHRWLRNVQHGRKEHGPDTSSYWQDEASKWLDQTPDWSNPLAHLEGLFWLAVLPVHKSHWPEPLLHALVDRLENLCCTQTTGDDANSVWCGQLVSELRLTISLLYPAVPWAEKWFSGARQEFARILQDWTDGDGLPQGEHVGWLWRLIAVWTRSHRVAVRCGKVLFDPEVTRLASRVLREAIRWARSDKSQLLDTSGESRWTKSLVRAAIEAFPGEVPLDRLARKALGKKVVRKCPGKRSFKLSRRTATNISEWSRAALLRASWNRSSAMLAVAFPSAGAMAEVVASKLPLLTGPVTTLITWDGVSVNVAGPVELLCQFVNKQMHYAEWQYNFDNQWVVQRQLALAPRDQFALVADAVIRREPAPGAWKYELRWPLASGTTFHQAAETHEGWLCDAAGRTRLVLPLVLPEWRSGPTVGSLSTQQHQLVYCARGHGSAFFAPLFIDLSNHRRGRPFTWRRLTVGENRSRVAADVAQGYRIQIGDEQWVVYRALRGIVPRTVLGQHWATEFVIARFDRRGQCQPLLEVETDHG